MYICTPRDHTRTVTGNATRHCLCDRCGCEIVPDQVCHCRSTWVDGQTPYEWESEFVTPSNQKPNLKGDHHPHV